MIVPEGLSNLLRRARAGEEPARAELLNRLRSALERLAKLHVGPLTAGESVSDLTQEASLRVWERVGEFAGSDDDELTARMLHKWLEQLVRHLAVNRHNARQAQKRQPERPIIPLETMGGDNDGSARAFDPAQSGPTPSAIVAAAEQEVQVWHAVEKVTDAVDRQILDLCFRQGLSLRAIADRLSLSYDVVRARYHAGLRSVERELEKLP